MGWHTTLAPTAADKRSLAPAVADFYQGRSAHNALKMLDAAQYSHIPGKAPDSEMPSNMRNTKNWSRFFTAKITSSRAGSRGTAVSRGYDCCKLARRGRPCTAAHTQHCTHTALSQHQAKPLLLHRTLWAAAAAPLIDIGHLQILTECKGHRCDAPSGDDAREPPWGANLLNRGSVVCVNITDQGHRQNCWRWQGA